MDHHISDGENADIDWNTDDELEIQNIGPTSCTTLVTRDAQAIISNGENIGPTSCTTSVSMDAQAIISNGEASSSAGSSNSNLVQHFLGMGFSERLVIQAIKENVEGDTESILETLLTHSALDNSPEEHNSCDLSYHQQEQCVNNDELSSDYDESLLEELSESDSWSWSDSETENGDSLLKHEKPISDLISMGFTVEEALSAMERCGPDASIAELTDMIYAAQMAKADTVFFEEEKPKNSCGLTAKQKRKLYALEARKKKKQKGPLTEEEEVIRLPNPMIGYGIPSESSVTPPHRELAAAAIGPPYFYYENVALTPKGVWDTISRFLYDVQPEFVDSKYFCAAARKRGYVHNLPIHNRFPILPLPPRTIHDAIPLTKRWWPEWDTRVKLNCLQTVYASAKLTDRIRKALEKCGDYPSLEVQKYVMDQCRKWNLVWVGKNKVAPLEPDEVEMLLGFPQNHTRGGGISRTDRYKSLGNSFQVDTVAYHLSVLKDLYPNGINVLSLFSGIGGAEVALHRLKIPLKNVVSVEISEANRDIVRSWWEQTRQTGNLVHLSDVRQLDGGQLEEFIKSFGGFDLIVGGSPCNNLTGSNRVSRDGLEGEHSSLFFHYFDILNMVKDIMKVKN
ncbi:putative DNA (cytosine-5-)-methyltransferase [Helianthus annuus]|uniref:DNA (cytosine-5-)-methyltransferase n=1 Tax=Helianthus annuus TaxID=4232 RepID=A0A251TXV5_HELAN|nr:DNA (cytosine-5)-methyltransferase DRM2 isoform X1 [Helianthus annuus]XP_021983418.1 DNA (cytosine-5)-methyltransferase DRM2 isoform X1 [Helianthus annuus]KAF5792179.1 putative DNA (cytosine-5-)-methyltransferase [Helianthus annuus]KAJ0527148.1 putative DNA (cytosine-5-)-methyltransferase [Helianthus annuus]KAJ0543549.1 putative DNA (cytosine-5-)-methyltransferase [Helianthus annuus]KAJ0708602.1 putative DNA (cytosine-5-)-methyltransferase [Helianthus annuus]KAJ0889634.1 putative DNA (cyto